jgi:hypothetical protein
MEVYDIELDSVKEAFVSSLTTLTNMKYISICIDN